MFAQAIRPPTVPAGTSRLRLTTMASHTPGELREAARTLAEAARRVGVDPEQVTAPPAAEPLQEIQEIETALVRAERLSGAARVESQPGGTAPFDFEVESSGEAPRARPLVAGEGRSARFEEPAPQGVGAPTELFDFERESSVRAA